MQASSLKRAREEDGEAHRLHLAQKRYLSLRGLLGLSAQLPGNWRAKNVEKLEEAVKKMEQQASTQGLSLPDDGGVVAQRSHPPAEAQLSKRQLELASLLANTKNLTERGLLEEEQHRRAEVVKLQKTLGKRGQSVSGLKSKRDVLDTVNIKVEKAYKRLMKDRLFTSIASTIATSGLSVEQVLGQDKDMKIEVIAMHDKIQQVFEEPNKVRGYAEFTTIKLAVQYQVKDNNIALAEAEKVYDALREEIRSAIDEADELKCKFERVQRGEVDAALSEDDDTLSQGFYSPRADQASLSMME